ncbi:MAG: transmembrane 220 family protein [Hyphomicrobiaceae bacterium]
MRILNGVLCLLMVLFAVVQYNDPDGLLWALIYAVPALFAGLAAWQPSLLHAGVARYAHFAAIAAAIATVIYYWPSADAFWRVDVWWNSETSREGMGAMICLVVLLAAWAGSIWRRPRAAAES